MLRMFMLLERREALGRLSQLLEQVHSGSGRVAFVSGEAGIGKTSLLRVFAQSPAFSSTRPLWGACDPLYTPRPLGPLHDMADDMGVGVRTALTRDAGRLEIFAAVLDALGREPRCVVFEDLHWADDATLDLLAYLGRRIERTHTLLLITYRDDELGPTHPLRRLLGALPGAARIGLVPLSPNAVRELAGSLVIDAATVHRVSGGNPFFATELLAVGDAAGVPLTVRDAILARAARLSAPARQVLEAAAVIGFRIEPALLGTVVDSDATMIEQCLAAGVLREVGATLEFRHELARQAVLESLSATRRQILHRRALRALRATPDIDLARLAHHAEAAQDRDAVLEFAPRAARQAAAVGARREAQAQYERALRFDDALPVAARADLLEAFALECLAVGKPHAGIGARQTVIELRQQLGEVASQAENLCRLTNLLVDVGRNAEADDALRRAFDLLRPLPPCRELAYAWRTQAHLSMLRSEEEESMRASEQAIALAERFGDVETLVSALNSQGTAMGMRDHEAGCTLLERSRQVARAAGRESQVFSADINLGELAIERHQFARAEGHLADAIAIADELQMDAAIAQSSLAVCWLHLGRWNDAGELANRVLASGLETRMGLLNAHLTLGRLRARRGDAGVWGALDEALRLATGTGQLNYLAPVRAVRAEAALLEGDPARCIDEARAELGRATAHRRAWFVGEMSWWLWRAGVEVELPDYAALPYALQIAGQWLEAASAWRDLACPFEEARALAEGDNDSQREALSIFERLGTSPAADALRQRLHAAGVRGLMRGPHTATREHPFGLTTRELQVLQLLCKGLRNAEIAQRLSRSVRTVDHHLAAVFAKLGVDSRVAAIHAAQHVGLDTPSGQSGQSSAPK